MTKEEVHEMVVRVTAEYVAKRNEKIALQKIKKVKAADVPKKTPEQYEAEKLAYEYEQEKRDRHLRSR